MPAQFHIHIYTHEENENTVGKFIYIQTRMPLNAATPHVAQITVYFIHKRLFNFPNGYRSVSVLFVHCVQQCTRIHLCRYLVSSTTTTTCVCDKYSENPLELEMESDIIYISFVQNYNNHVVHVHTNTYKEAQQKPNLTLFINT